MTRADPGAGASRELAAAVLLAVAGGALAFWAASRVWTVTESPRAAGLPALRTEITGRDSVPWAAAMSFVAMAGGMTLLAVRRRLRAVLGGALVLTGIVTVSGGLTGSLTAGSSYESVETLPAWPAVFAAAGIAVLLGGGLVLLRGAYWTAVGDRYDREGPAPTDAGLWDAMDRGEDPTSL